MIADYGIFLEMGGFALMLLFWKRPTHKSRERWMTVFQKIPFLTKSDYKWKYMNPSNNIGWKPHEGGSPLVPKSFAMFWEYGASIGIAFVIVGLFLQHSWFANNFPQI